MFTEMCICHIFSQLFLFCFCFQGSNTKMCREMFPSASWHTSLLFITAWNHFRTENNEDNHQRNLANNRITEQKRWWSFTPPATWPRRNSPLLSGLNRSDHIGSQNKLYVSHMQLEVQRMQGAWPPVTHEQSLHSSGSIEPEPSEHVQIMCISASREELRNNAFEQQFEQVWSHPVPMMQEREAVQSGQPSELWWKKPPLTSGPHSRRTTDSLWLRRATVFL